MFKALAFVVVAFVSVFGLGWVVYSGVVFVDLWVGDFDCFECVCFSGGLVVVVVLLSLGLFAFSLFVLFDELVGVWLLVFALVGWLLPLCVCLVGCLDCC